MKIKILLLTCLLAQGCVYKATAIAHIKGLNSNQSMEWQSLLRKRPRNSGRKTSRCDSESLAIHIRIRQSSHRWKKPGGHWNLPMKIMVNGVFHHFIAEILKHQYR